jgi:hypothetical protein
MLPFPTLRSLCVTVAAAALVAAPLHAQSIPSPYRFIEKAQEGGIFVGYFDTDAGRFGFGPKSAVYTGIRYGLELAGPLGLEGVASVVPTDRDVINPGRDEGDRVVDVAEATLLFVEARLRFALTGRRTWNRLQPFASAGIGLGMDVQGSQREDQLLLEADRFDFGTKFVGSFGAGTRVILGRNFTVRVDASVLLYQLSTPNGFEDPERDLGNVPESEWVAGRGLTLGLSYRF